MAETGGEMIEKKTSGDGGEAEKPLEKIPSKKERAEQLKKEAEAKQEAEREESRKQWMHEKIGEALETVHEKSKEHFVTVGCSFNKKWREHELSAEKRADKAYMKSNFFPLGGVNSIGDTFVMELPEVDSATGKPRRYQIFSLFAQDYLDFAFVEDYEDHDLVKARESAGEKDEHSKKPWCIFEARWDPPPCATAISAQGVDFSKVLIDKWSAAILGFYALPFWDEAGKMKPIESPASGYMVTYNKYTGKIKEISLEYNFEDHTIAEKRFFYGYMKQVRDSAFSAINAFSEAVAKAKQVKEAAEKKSNQGGGSGGVSSEKKADNIKSPNVDVHLTKIGKRRMIRGDKLRAKDFVVVSRDEAGAVVQDTSENMNADNMDVLMDKIRQTTREAIDQAIEAKAALLAAPSEEQRPPPSEEPVSTVPQKTTE